MFSRHWCHLMHKGQIFCPSVLDLKQYKLLTKSTVRVAELI